MYRISLVPLDGSTFGEQALPLAVNIARRCEAHCTWSMCFRPWATCSSRATCSPTTRSKLTCKISSCITCTGSPRSCGN